MGDEAAAESKFASADPLSIVLTGARSARGIPEMKFLDDIETTISTTGVAIETLLQALNTMYRRAISPCHGKSV